VEGQYPIHWAYDLNGVRKFINGSPEGSKIRSQFDEMVRNAIYFQYDFKRAGKLTTDEWDSVDKDIEMKLNTLVEIGKDVENNELDQAIELFTKFLNEAQESQDYMRYMTVVEGMETLYNYLKK
jgi:hypothetical protein